MHTVRPAAVAGTFYPARDCTLSSAVRDLMADAAPVPDSTLPAPKALIVPHAGYIYSGATAAQAYARLRPARSRIRRVVLLGPVHHVPVRGLALPGVEAFATPLGEIAIDPVGVAALTALPQVLVSAAAHAPEHSLEVQLPFLQLALDDFKLVPLAVGDATAAEVAEVLERLWGGAETLIVISSDLSHFLPYRMAQTVDHETVRHILEFSAAITHQQACGGTPINGLLLAAKRHGLRPELLELCNSGDVTGDKGRVVGYAAFAFLPCAGSAHGGGAAGSQEPAGQPGTQGLAPGIGAGRPHNPGPTLLALARASISTALGHSVEVAQDPPWLLAPGASFVTLTQKQQLRGCIGSLQAHRSLRADVQANAVAAALQDPRFEPLTLGELAGTEIEVSLLSPLERLKFEDQAHALRQLQPGVDGVVFEYEDYRSTFLPQVWEQLPSPAQFLAHLKHKAGLRPDFWAKGVHLSRYSVSKWKEGELAAPTVPANQSGGA